MCWLNRNFPNIFYKPLTLSTTPITSNCSFLRNCLLRQGSHQATKIKFPDICLTFHIVVAPSVAVGCVSTVAALFLIFARTWCDFVVTSCRTLSLIVRASDSRRILCCARRCVGYWTAVSVCTVRSTHGRPWWPRPLHAPRADSV